MKWLFIFRMFLMQCKMINWISAPVFMAPRTRSVISCHCCIYGAKPLPVLQYFSLTARLYKKAERQLLGMVVMCWFRMVFTTQCKRGSNCTSHRISQYLWRKDLKPRCVFHLCDLYFVFPPNEMRLSADPNIPNNLELFKSQNQPQLWVL